MSKFMVTRINFKKVGIQSIQSISDSWAQLAVPLIMESTWNNSSLI